MYINISDAIKKAEKESKPRPGVSLRPGILETVRELKKMQQTIKRGCGGDTLRGCVENLEFRVSSEIVTPLATIIESSKEIKKELQVLYFLIEALDKESVGPVSIFAD